MTLEKRLADWSQGSAAARAVELALRLRVPDAGLGEWHSLEELAERMEATEEQVVAARARLAEDDALAAVAALDHLDEQDGLWANLKAAGDVIAAWRDGRTDRAALATRQGEDAMFKALVLAWAVDRLFPGPPEEQVRRFLELEAGRALVGLYGLIEVALPFAQEVAEEGMLGRIAAQHAEGGMKAVVAKLGEGAPERIRGVMPLLVGELEAAITAAAGDVDGVLETARKIAPAAAGAADAAGDVAAAGLDLLPVYHLIGPRFAAEACLQREILGEPVQPPADVAADLVPSAPDAPAPPAPPEAPDPPAPPPPPPAPSEVAPPSGDAPASLDDARRPVIREAIDLLGNPITEDVPFDGSTSLPEPIAPPPPPPPPPEPPSPEPEAGPPPIPEAEPPPVPEPPPVQEAEPPPLPEPAPTSGTEASPASEAEPPAVPEAEPPPVPQAEPPAVPEAEPPPVPEAEPPPVPEVEPPPVAEVEPPEAGPPPTPPAAEAGVAPAPEPTPDTDAASSSEVAAGADAPGGPGPEALVAGSVPAAAGPLGAPEPTFDLEDPAGEEPGLPPADDPTTDVEESDPGPSTLDEERTPEIDEERDFEPTVPEAPRPPPGAPNAVPTRPNITMFDFGQADVEAARREEEAGLAAGAAKMPPKPGGSGAVAAPPRRRSRMGLMVGLAVVALVVLLGCGGTVVAAGGVAAVLAGGGDLLQPAPAPAPKPTPRPRPRRRPKR